MEGTRVIGLSHAYLDSKIKDFSNVASGLLIRAMGYGLKVAYVDVRANTRNFSNFLENLSLSSSFVKFFKNYKVDIYTIQEKGQKITKSLLPQVEYSAINKETFWDMMGKYDLVILENVSFEVINKYAMINFVQNHGQNVELVVTFSDPQEFNEIKGYFDLVTEYDYKKNKLLGTKDKIISITGNGKGKSTYSFGMAIRKFIEKENVKLIYFDKGGDFYGERVFFEALRRWCKQVTLYGEFDYAVSGLRRFDGKNFRFENVQGDIDEARNGLELVRTTVRKKAFVIAEELNTTVKTGLLKQEDVENVMKEVSKELVMTGRYAMPEILKQTNLIIEVKEHKHYAKDGHGVRKGIDF